MSQEATLSTTVPPPAEAAAVDFRVDGPIPPRKVPFAYTFTLALTAFAVVLLPALYVATIIAAACGLKYYALHATAIFGLVQGFGAVTLYLTPLVAGAIMILFMIKPLLAQPARREGGYLLDLENEPRLRDTISAICRQVGAPMPVEVRVDCSINASAGLRRGVLSLGKKELVLNLGLPLAGRLTARQLAGVLAHEFGHFRQGTGMAFGYLIRSVNGWFARVVFERDAWDELLADEARDAGYGVGFVLWIAQAAIWLSRQVLFLFLQLGHIITCLQSRQAEYDADYYEAQVAGSIDFNKTSRELRLLTMVERAALAELAELWNSRQLVDDLPAYIATRRAQLTTEEIGKIDGAAIREKPGWFDTHPTEVERGTRVRALRLPGLFRGEAPATALFRDFTALSREATLHYYREQLKLKFGDESLVATAGTAHASKETAEGDAARVKLLGNVLNPLRPMLWATDDFSAPLTEPGPVVAAQLSALQAQLTSQRIDAEPLNATYDTLYAEFSQARVAHAFHLPGVVVQPGTFDLQISSLANTELRLKELAHRLAAKRDALRPFEAAFHAWACLVGRAARTPSLSATLSSELTQQIVTLTTAIVQLRPWFHDLPEWSMERSVLAVLAASEANFAGDRRFAQLLTGQREKVRALVIDAPRLVTGTIWPFPSPGAPRSITEHLERSLYDVHGDARSLVLVRVVTELYFRLIGQLAKLGSDLEIALLPSPPPPDDPVP